MRVDTLNLDTTKVLTTQRKDTYRPQVVNMPLQGHSHGRPRHGSRAPPASNPAPGWNSHQDQDTIDPRFLLLTQPAVDPSEQGQFFSYSSPVSLPHPATEGNPPHATWSYDSGEPYPGSSPQNLYLSISGATSLAEGA